MSASSSKPLPLQQRPSGFMGKIFGKLMEWTNISAYRKAIETLNTAPRERCPPEEFSTRIAASLVVFATAFTLFIYLKNGVFTLVHVVNGFALLGLSGTLFRLVLR